MTSRPLGLIFIVATAFVGCGQRQTTAVQHDEPPTLSVTHWTDRTEISWAEDTLIGIMLLPVILLLFGIAFFNRHQTLLAWRNGPSIHASVVEIKHSATAPRSRILRMVLANYHDQRIFTTLIPTRRSVYQPGDIVWVIIPSTTPRWAILAELYE